MWQWRKVIHKILPLAISGALIGWLLSRISLDEVLRAAGELNWRLLAPLTACMVMALYVWDSLCLKTVFALDNRKLEFGKMLRIRGISYLVGAFNYELGQAFIAWSMTRQMGVGLLFTLSRSVLLAYHDLFVLLSLGLCGWLLAGGGAAAAIGTVCSVGLVCLIAVGMTIALLPRPWRERFEQTRWGAWLQSWPLARSIRLAGLRLVYFGILIVYGGLALWICEIPVGPMVVLGTIPLVLVADALPSVAGLGTRETALLLLLKPDSPATLLAMSLFWSTGMIVCRLAIGLLLLWLPASRQEAAIVREAAVANRSSN